jgi:hypothetical protein
VGSASRTEQLAEYTASKQALESNAGTPRGARLPVVRRSAARFTGERDLDRVRALNPGLGSFADWLAERGDELKAATN